MRSIPAGFGIGFAILLPFLTHAIEYDLHGSYFRLDAGGKPITVERLDPIMSPGVEPSNHVHNIFGGDGFSSDWTFDKAKAGSCNNMGPSKDHSNYWFPALYHHADDGTYTRLPVQMVAYYHFDVADNGPRTMFPPGLKIMAGNAMLRHDDSATNKATASITWWCHDGDNKKVAGFPDGVTTCTGTNGFSAEIWFPFCWDGVEEFDPADPTAHVVYADDGNRPQGGKCSGNHSMALPQLFIEFNHDTSVVGNKKGAAQPWVLAQGDPTGAGFHADFVNGWEDAPGSLSDAIKADNSNKYGTKCYVGLTDGGPSKCLDMLPDDKKTGCTLAQSYPEEVDTPGNALPGCNPIQNGPEDATIQTNCPGYKAPSGTKQNAGVVNGVPEVSSMAQAKPSQASTDTPMPSVVGGTHDTQPGDRQPPSTGSGSLPPITLANGQSWTYQGCYSDLVPDRNIRTLPNWGRGNTPTECAENCAGSGYQMSGVEYGNQCFCGNALVMTQAKKLDDSQCNTKCEGSASELCGGTGALSVYAKKSGGSKTRKRSHLKQHAHYHGHSH